MKAYNVEIKNIYSQRAFNLKIDSQNLISSPEFIFIVWTKVGYNGEYSKVFKKNQKEFDNSMHLCVFEKSKELYPEHFL